VEGPRHSNVERPASNDKREAERAERNRQYDALYEQSSAAWDRHDYREALRLYKQQQKLRNGPTTRAGIAELEALIVWSEAKTAKEYRRAMAMRPESAWADPGG